MTLNHEIIVKDFFLSYASSNSSIVSSVSSELQKLGFSTWIDDKELSIGDSLLNRIQQGLLASRFIVVFISKDYLSRKWTIAELNAALMNQLETEVKKILPIVIDIDQEAIQKNIPFLADKLHIKWNNDPSAIASMLGKVINNKILTSTSASSPLGLEAYVDNLSAEIHNNLVLELFDRSHYDDLCITPLLESLSKQQSVPISIYQLVIFKRSAIIGEPGSGKTTALRKLTLELLRDPKIPITPIYLSLAAYSREQESHSFTKFEDFINHELAVYGLNSSISNLISSKPVILLLDGWDEVNKDIYYHDIKKFLASHDYSFIISSRPETQRLLPYSDLYSMKGLNLERMISFLSLRIRDPKTVQTILKWIKSDHELYRLAQNPLNLSIISIVFQEDSSYQIINKSHLYERAFTSIINQYNRAYPFEGELESKSRNSIVDIMKVLSKLAYTSIWQEHGRFFTNDQLNSVVFEVFDFIPTNILHVLSGKLGLIRDRRSGRMEFFHLWYQEYLAARYIIDQKIDFLLLENKPNFDSVFSFVVGLNNNSNERFTLLKQKTLNDPFTYCRAVKEGLLDSKQLKTLILRVISFGEHSTPKLPVRLVLSQALTIIGKSIILPMQEILKERERSDYTRRCALECFILLESKSELVIEVIDEILSDSSDGLTWHILEHIGKHKLDVLKNRVIPLTKVANPITAGDATWALHQIANKSLIFTRINELIELLKSDDSHVQGHALRTIGRLRINAIPELMNHLKQKKSSYRWIVPEAAALIGGNEIYDLFHESLIDDDLRVVSSSLISLRTLKDVPREITSRVEIIGKRKDWIPHMNQRLGTIANQTLEAIHKNNQQLQFGQVLLARHCKTQWNIEHKLQGSKDLPLSEIGISEAQKMTSSLNEYKITRIVTSNYQRAYETAQIYAKSLNVPLNVHTGLREIDHGDWEGKKMANLLEKEDSKYALWVKNPSKVSIPGGGESILMAKERVVEAYRDITYKYPEDIVLIVSHKHIRALLLCSIYNKSLDHFGKYIIDDIRPFKIKKVEQTSSVE
ncbi:MAG: histidine phosphatase family protein [Bacteroidia bacterium]